jgi:GNAT superfamily N-acetyltransferase
MRVSDIGFYVNPNHRGSRAAIKLLAKLEDWARDNNINDVCIGQTTAVNMEKTQQFYNRLGYKTVGFNTIKHLEK